MMDLRQGDCLELLKDIPDESIDLIVTDPPYKLTSRGSSGTMGGYWKEEKAKKELYIDAYKKWKNICKKLGEEDEEK